MSPGLVTEESRMRPGLGNVVYGELNTQYSLLRCCISEFMAKGGGGVCKCVVGEWGSGGVGVMTCILHVQNVYYFRNNTCYFL